MPKTKKQPAKHQPGAGFPESKLSEMFSYIPDTHVTKVRVPEVELEAIGRWAIETAAHLDEVDGALARGTLGDLALRRLIALDALCTMLANVGGYGGVGDQMATLAASVRRLTEEVR